MTENNKIIDEIIRYYMNPAKYPNKDKDKIIGSIVQINDALKGETSENELMNELFSRYTSKDINTPIVSTIYKTRADEQGISATKGYKEIYFNEIIQNANDNTTGDHLDIVLVKKGSASQYELIFEYADEGFSVENIIGFMNTEIHTKKNNLAATGKHGVGIKSLFYFVDFLRIESNVFIEFDIQSIIENEIEKIKSVSTIIKKNNDWGENKMTRLIIRFPEKADYGEYNIRKLTDFISECYSHDYKAAKRFFLGSKQEELIFDARGLLFTDKNKNKDKGVKIIKFYKNNVGENNCLFSVKVDVSNDKLVADNKTVRKETIWFNSEEQLSYLVFTLEGEGNQQNFSVAFPNAQNLNNTGRRYYETYFIPSASEGGGNILINSKYSNVSRTKLTDEDYKLQDIYADIESKLLAIYKFMVSKECAESSLGFDISLIFHKLLFIDSKFVDICSAHNINNRFLKKQTLDVSENGRYLVYRRNEKEAYEKKLIGQKIDKYVCISYVNRYILGEDSILYSKEKFDREISNIYEKAFTDNYDKQYELRKILNVAGNIRDLIYYRVKGVFPANEQPKLVDSDIDNWNAQIWDNNIDLIIVSLSLFGRYKLHEYISNTGEIRGALFYEYLFSKEVEEGEIRTVYPSMKNKQQELYRNQYASLKKRLRSLMTNREEEGQVSLYGLSQIYEKGTVAFYASWRSNAGTDTYYDFHQIKIYDFNESSTDSFGSEIAEIFIRKLAEEKEILSHCVCMQDKLMICSSEYPSWGKPTCCYERNGLMATGKWFTCSMININFIRKMYAHSFETLKAYTAFLESQCVYDIVQEYQKFDVFTSKDKDALFSVNANELAEVMKFFYEKDRYNRTKETSEYRIHFRINLDGEINNNLCPSDYFDFIYKNTGKKIYVIQSNSIDGRKQEILYWYKNNFKLIVDSEWHNIGLGIQNNGENRIYIIHTERVDYKEAIAKVLSNIYGKSSIIERCNAFISSNQHADIDSVAYNEFSGNKLDINPNYRRITYDICSKNFTCEVLKRAILGRGNNDGKCCCCGKKIYGGRFIITNNVNEDTNRDYPQIMEVVCNRCEELLRRSHKKTELMKKDSGYVLKYCCEIQNTSQRKEICIETRIYDGVLALTRSENK